MEEIWLKVIVLSVIYLETESFICSTFELRTNQLTRSGITVSMVRALNVIASKALLYDHVTYLWRTAGSFSGVVSRCRRVLGIGSGRIASVRASSPDYNGGTCKYRRNKYKWYANSVVKTIAHACTRKHTHTHTRTYIQTNTKTDIQTNAHIQKTQLYKNQKFDKGGLPGREAYSHKNKKKKV